MQYIYDIHNGEKHSIFSEKGKYLLKQYVKTFQSGGANSDEVPSLPEVTIGNTIKDWHTNKNSTNETRRILGNMLGQNLGKTEEEEKENNKISLQIENALSGFVFKYGEMFNKNDTIGNMKLQVREVLKEWTKKKYPEEKRFICILRFLKNDNKKALNDSYKIGAIFNEGDILKIDWINKDLTKEFKWIENSKEILKSPSKAIIEYFNSNINSIKENEWRKEALKNIILALFIENPQYLSFERTPGKLISEIINFLKSDKDVLLDAVENNGLALSYASKNLQNDKYVVLAAVTKDGNALQFASERLQNDKDVVLAAVTSDGSTLQYASDELKNDEDFMKKVNEIKK